MKKINRILYIMDIAINLEINRLIIKSIEHGIMENVVKHYENEYDIKNMYMYQYNPFHVMDCTIVNYYE